MTTYRRTIKYALDASVCEFGHPLSPYRASACHCKVCQALGAIEWRAKNREMVRQSKRDSKRRSRLAPAGSLPPKTATWLAERDR